MSRWEAALPDLPPSAILSSEGATGALSIFGLPESPVSWGEFGSAVSKNRYGESWQDAIRAVVVSSLPSQVTVDNAQIVLSHDGADLHRVILTSGTRHFDGTREFRIYLVEGLKRSDYGHEETSLLLKAIELVCRYRFMFLEEVSPFVKNNIEIISNDLLFDIAGNIIREIDWLRRDAREAKLDDTTIWAAMLGSYDLIAKVSNAYRPCEKELRVIALAIRRAKVGGNDLAELRSKFANAVDSLAQSTNSVNREIMIALTKRLDQYVEAHAVTIGPGNVGKVAVSSLPGQGTKSSSA
jgi:hypothetical protein